MDDFPKKTTKESIDEYMQRYMHSSTQRQKRKNKPVDDDISDEDDDLVGLWEAYNLKKTFVLNESVHEIAEMKEDDMLKIMQQKRDKKTVFEPINHAKTLIIISGNLDEAYSMADEAGETDVDADIFRAFTEKITIIDIKKALSRKFKPEQVARFGNIHLIYRSLKKQDFNALIDLEIRKIEKRNIEHFALKTTITDAVKQLVYQNGVFLFRG
jgi:cell division protease FtsH